MNWVDPGADAVYCAEAAVCCSVLPHVAKPEARCACDGLVFVPVVLNGFLHFAEVRGVEMIGALATPVFVGSVKRYRAGFVFALRLNGCLRLLLMRGKGLSSTLEMVLPH